MFSKNERGTFRYWCAHWMAFNMTALNLNCWKFKYLFHDIEKPFLKLFWDYKKVQKFHRFHNRHHMEYFFDQYSKKGKCDDYDFEATVIDWECSKLTKSACTRNAEEEIEFQYNELTNCRNMYIADIVSKNIDYFVKADSGEVLSRYTILVEKFFEKMREKLEKIGLKTIKN